MIAGNVVIGVDVGGTKIAAATVTAAPVPAVGDCTVVPTFAAEGFERSLNQLFTAIDGRMGPEVQAIGICAPGPLNPRTGVVINPPNLPGWSNVPLRDIVDQRFGLPCRVENDANAAGLAEALFGAGRGHDNVLYATLSTGIGAGIIINGRIYHGKNGAAGEAGHLSIDYRSRYRCNCGTLGCIEALASGTALAARGLDPRSLDDTDLDELTEQLSAWLGGLVSLLDPDIIVLGGGMSEIGDPLFDRLRRLTPTRTINQFAAQTPIVPARLARDVGVLGAASVVLSEVLPGRCTLRS
jgi:glucokinase